MPMAYNQSIMYRLHEILLVGSRDVYCMLDDLLPNVEEVEQGKRNCCHRPEMKSSEHIVVGLIFIDVGSNEGLFGTLKGRLLCL